MSQSPIPKNGHVLHVPRKTVSREQLVELIRARVKSQLNLDNTHIPLPVQIAPGDGVTNWKVDKVVGVPSGAVDGYMAIIQELMQEYELR